jgi:hypothetical protein
MIGRKVCNVALAIYIFSKKQTGTCLFSNISIQRKMETGRMPVLLILFSGFFLRFPLALILMRPKVNLGR